MAACSLLVSLPDATFAAMTYSGDSTTILRLRQGTGDRDLYPLYEYLHLGGSTTGTDGTLSLLFGGWGRVDLADKSTEDYRQGDLQYGYLSYRANRNNLVANVGRQFVTEGVASEKLDGVYLRSDLAAGFQGSLFLGSPADTEPNLQGSDIIYGGRIAHSVPTLYTIGFSALKANGGHSEREEEGVDLWLRPIQMLDLTGRTSYNSRTGGFMEHAYTATINATDKLRVSAGISRINYRDYFHQATTSALSLTTTPGLLTGQLAENERSLAIGGSAGYDLTRRLGLAADFMNFHYEVAGDARYYGVRATYTVPESYSAGVTLHRMDGDTDRLTYNEFRIYASRRAGPLDLTVDFIDIQFDHAINDIHNTFTVVGAVGYQLLPGLTAAADLAWARTTEMDMELRGLLKLTYVFNSERRAAK